MDQEFFKFPDKISHQRLVDLLSSASRQVVEDKIVAHSSIEIPFDDLATDWLMDGEWIMEEIESMVDGMRGSRSAQQKVALSAFVVHLSLAMASLDKALGKVKEEGDG